MFAHRLARENDAQPHQWLQLSYVVENLSFVCYGESALRARLLRSSHFLLPGRVSKCGAIMETSWPAATMVLRILLRYASTKKNVSPSNFKQHYSRLTRSL